MLVNPGIKGIMTAKTKKIAATHHGDSLEPSTTAWLEIIPLKALVKVNLTFGFMPVFFFFNFFAIFNP